MPAQEVCFRKAGDDHRIEVSRIYDRQYAREVFDSMDDAAHSVLRSSLGMDEFSNDAETSTFSASESTALVWEELIRASSDVGQIPCFFVTVWVCGTGRYNLYVSPDASSAETFAQALFTDQP